MTNCAPVAWRGSRIFYNSLGTDGMFDGWSANADGSDAVCLTDTVPVIGALGTATNRGIGDVSPDGQWMLVTVEGEHVGTIGAEWTQPGKGGANDVWLLSADGESAWQLTQPTGLVSGVIWPRFGQSAQRIMWAQMTAIAMPGQALGHWQLQVADFDASAHAITSQKAVGPPNQFFEPYGFSPDGKSIICATSDGQSSIATDQIGLMAIATGKFTPLTHNKVYNEFAFYTPGGKSIIFGQGSPKHLGMDYWSMNPDGSGPERLTFFNDTAYADVETLAFDPAGSGRVAFTVANDAQSQHCDGYVETLQTT